MKTLAFDISKKSTGIAFYDGKTFDGVKHIAFTDSKQWGAAIDEELELWKPDVVVFSETMNRMFGQSTKRIMFGLMYHLELLCFKRDLNVIVINDVQAKHHLGIKMNKENKGLTIMWAKEFIPVEVDDEADAMSFAYYIDATVNK